MNQLVPCPECSRHVRVSETECPFCALPLDLAGTPEPQLPRARLGRAATFAFGATLVSATALAACGGDATSDDSSAGGTSNNTAGTGGNSSNAGAAGFGGTGSIIPAYGIPAGGSVEVDPNPGTAGTQNGGNGSGGPIYGAAP